MCTVILFRLTTLHMIGNKLFYNNIIQNSHGAGTIVVLTTGFIQCKVYLSQCLGCMADTIVTAVMSRSAYNMYSNFYNE